MPNKLQQRVGLATVGFYSQPFSSHCLHTYGMMDKGHVDPAQNYFNLRVETIFCLVGLYR